MRIACHALHSYSQLSDPDNAALLRECGVLVVAPEWGGLSNLAAAWGRIVEAAPHARLLLSFNPKALYFGDRGRSAWWQKTRGALLSRTREDGTPAFLYRSQDWGGDPRDPGDPTPHLGLTEPTLENGEALAAVIRERVDEVREAIGGAAPVDPYIDDAPRQRPARLSGPPRDQGRWEGYLACLIAGLRGFTVYTNCAGNPPAPFVGICCEYPSTRPSLMMRLTLEDRMANMGFADELPEGEPPHILWGGEECAGLWRAGRYLK